MCIRKPHEMLIVFVNQDIRTRTHMNKHSLCSVCLKITVEVKMAAENCWKDRPKIRLSAILGAPAEFFFYFLLLKKASNRCELVL